MAEGQGREKMIHFTVARRQRVTNGRSWEERDGPQLVPTVVYSSEQALS